jgi:RND family efflux transporter MFP subunit
MRPPVPMLFLALAALPACGERGAPPASAPAAAPRETAAARPAAAPQPRSELASPSAIRLVVPEAVRYTARLSATGTLKARQSSTLAMSLPGTLARIAVRRGQEVREGTLLASLDDAAAAAAAKQAAAGVAAARAQLALADDGLSRAIRIREQEGLSEAQLFQARSQRELAAAQLLAAEAQLEQAKVNLAHHQLRAPFDGVVTRVPDGIGITVAAGTAVVTLVATRQLLLETSLTQEEAARLRPGTKVEVTVPATGARSSSATVATVVAAVDPATDRVPVEITVPNPDGRFMPNASARAELAGGEERASFRVPSAALVQRDGGYAVWVVGPDGRARRHPVRLHAEEGDTALVAPEAGRWPEGLRVVDRPPLGIAEGAALAEAVR